jgi:hypothetical protein
VTTDLSALLSPSEAARRLGLSKQRVMQLVGAGALHPTVTPIGRLFDPVEVDRLVVEREAARGG